jgi:uncharacterized protein involved in outer membrane biogenesis
MKHTHARTAHSIGAGILRKTILIAVIAVSVLVCAVAVVVVLNLPLSLSPFKENIEAAAHKALGISVAIEGDSYLIPGRWPVVEIRGLRLWRPSRDGTPDLLRLEYLRVGVAILPLLKRELRITEIAAWGLNLELKESDDSNTESGNETRKPSPQEGDSGAIENEPPIQKVEVTRIDLRNLTVAVRGETSDHIMFFPEIAGSATDREGLKLSVKCEYQHISWDMAIDGGSLTALLARAGDWPLSLSVNGAGAGLRVRSRIHPTKSSATLDLQLSGSTGPQLEALLGQSVADFGDYRLAFHLDVAGSRVRVSELEGELGNTRFSGEGQWDGAGRRLTGVVNATVLDLEPLIWSAYPNENQNIESTPNIFSGANKELSLPETLAGLSVDFRIAIDRIVGFPGDFRNLTACLVSTDKGLRLPVSMNVLGTTVGGEATLAGKEKTVKLAVDLAANKTNLGHLAYALSGKKGLAGRLDGFDLSAASTGADLDTLLKNLEAKLDIHNADISINGESTGRPMRILLESATMSLPAGGDMKGSVSGILLDEPFSLDVSGGGMRDIVDSHRLPVDLRFAGSGAKLHLTGTLTPLGDTVGPELTIRLSGERLGELSTWIGISPSAQMPYALDAAVLLRRNRWRLEIGRLSLGNSTLKGSIGRESPANQQLKTAVSIHADLVDVTQLKTVFLMPENKDEPGEKDFARILETTVFPEDLHLPEMEVSLNLRRVLTDKLTYDRCSLEASILRNRTTSSRFQFDLGEASFSGDASLDLSRQLPALGLRFSANRLDIGELLEDIGVAEKIDVSAKSLEVLVNTRGRRLSDLIVQREISVRLQKGQWVLKDANTGATVTIGLHSAEYADRPGEPLQLNLRGHIRDIPLSVRWEAQKKRPEDAPDAGHAYRFEAEVAGTRLELTGHLVFPLKRRGVAHRFFVSGGRLDSLEPLLNISLPPLGPFEVSGVLRIPLEGYSLSDATVSMGDSRFIGQLDVVTSGPRPKVAANLKAKTIQLRDFGRKASTSGEKWPKAADPQPGNTGDEERRRRLRGLFDPSMDNAMDADISIEVAEVLAGANRLGSGTLRVVRSAGRLSISPLALSIPGGDVNCALELTNTDGGVHGTLKAEIHRLDYGALLRLKDPNTINVGTASLVIDLESKAESAEALLAAADGQVAVSIQPENIQAGVLDFWAVNLLTAVLPVLNPKNESKINCIVADLVMNDGVMKEKSFVIDTSKIRVRGKIHVDFKKQTVYLRLMPTPKRPQFLSLATPLEVRGKFSDLKVSLAPGGLIGTTIRFLTAHIVVPIQWIILKRLPKDGSDVCHDVIRQD